MGYAIRGDNRQRLVLPPCVEDWVPADSPARYISNFVDGMNLTEQGFSVSEEGVCGTNFYADDMLLKVWLYGYFHGVRSTRKLEELCLRDIGAIWLTGMHYPDHNTLWRFFNRNRSVFSEVLLKATFAAEQNGLIGLVLHALDGTKIRARVSDSSGWHKKSLEKKLKELSRGVSEVVGQVDASEKAERFEYALPEEFCDEDAQKAGIEQALAKMSAIKRSHLHPLDEDARMTKCGKGSSFCFNAQAVVDDASGLIVAQDVVSDEADNELLVPMIEKVEETLGARAEETVADAGYYSPNQLLEAEEKGFDILVNINKAIAPKNAAKFHKSKFVYDEEEDVFICPLGKELCFEGTRKSNCGKYRERIYRCRSFKECTELDACSNEKRGRKITMGPHHQALMRQLEKQKIPEKKEQLSKRKCIVERIFAFIKEVMGFRRFTVRGLEKVKAQWALICTAFNLRKLFKLWCAKKKVFA